MKEQAMATERDALNYAPLHAFAEQHRVSYNELCAAVHAALAAPPVEPAIAPPALIVEAIYKALSSHALARTSFENVTDVIDAIYRVWQAAPPAEQQAAKGVGGKIVDRLLSSDPQFDDCADAAVLINKQAKAIDLLHVAICQVVPILNAAINPFRVVEANGILRQALIDYADSEATLSAPTEQPAAQAGAAEQQYGYDTAFYELAALMGFTAQPVSPERAWRDQMLPRLKAALASVTPAEPVGTLNVQRFRGHLENTSFDYTGSLPDGSYQLYAAHPTEQPSQDAAWQKIGDEVALILSDPDSELSRGAKRALDWIAARAAQAQAQGESTGGTPHG